MSQRVLKSRDGQYKAVVKRNVGWDEWVVRFYSFRTNVPDALWVRLEDADYFTDDPEDAVDTAKAELVRLSR